MLLPWKKNAWKSAWIIQTPTVLCSNPKFECVSFRFWRLFPTFPVGRGVESRPQRDKEPLLCEQRGAQSDAGQGRAEGAGRNALVRPHRKHFPLQVVGQPAQPETVHGSQQHPPHVTTATEIVYATVLRRSSKSPGCNLLLPMAAAAFSFRRLEELSQSGQKVVLARWTMSEYKTANVSWVTRMQRSRHLIRSRLFLYGKSSSAWLMVSVAVINLYLGLQWYQWTRCVLVHFYTIKWFWALRVNYFNF